MAPPPSSPRRQRTPAGKWVWILGVAAVAVGAWKGMSPPRPSPSAETVGFAHPGTKAPSDVNRAEQFPAPASHDSDSLRRDQAPQTTLQDWVHRDLNGAITWVLSQPDDERLAQASALLIALADRPDDAVQAAQRLCREDPHFVREHGDSVLAVLTASGEFKHAVQFAGQGGPERNTWLSQAFSRWAEASPATAAEAAIAFSADDALPAVFTIWAAQNRKAATHFATTSTAIDPTQRSIILNLIDPSGG